MIVISPRFPDLTDHSFPQHHLYTTLTAKSSPESMEIDDSSPHHQPLLSRVDHSFQRTLYSIKQSDLMNHDGRRLLAQYSYSVPVLIETAFPGIINQQTSTNIDNKVDVMMKYNRHDSNITNIIYLLYY